MPMQDCEDGGKRWGDSGKCYTGPDAARKAYAQGMAIGDVGKAEFEGLWGPFTKDDLTEAVIAVAVEKYNPNHDDNGHFSSLDHVPDSAGTRFTLGDAVKHMETGRIGMVTETHPDKKGKNHEASVLFGDREGIFRSNVHQAMKSQRVATGKLQVVSSQRLPKAAAERCQVFKDWAQFDAQRSGGQGPASMQGRPAGTGEGRGRGGLLNQVAGVLAQAGHAMQGGRNRNGFMLRGGAGGGGGGTAAKGKGGGRGGRKGRVAAPALTGRLRAAAQTGIKGLRGQKGLQAVQGLHKDDLTGGGDNPESVRVSYRGKNRDTALAAAHNTLHHAGLDSVMHNGPLAGPHLHVGPQSQQAGPLTYGSIGDGLAQDIESGVKPDRALISALHTAGVVRDSNNPAVDVDQAVIDDFVAQVQQGADPAELAQQIINALQNPDVKKQQPSATDVHVNAVAGAINPGRMHKYVDNGSGRCKVCNGVQDQGIHKGESIDKLEITFPVWIDKAVEKQVAYGVALHPGLRDSQGDVVTEDDIERAAHRFMVRYRETGVGHIGDGNPTIQVVESYLAPEEMTFIDNLGREHKVLKGSWILAHKHNDPALWERVKKGIEYPDDPDALGSLSIQGSGVRLAE